MTAELPLSASQAALRAQQWAASSLAGARGPNEDRWGADGQLFAVADGMGGLAAGDQAATVAIRSLFANHQRHEGLAQAIQIVNTSVRALSHRLRQATGTTLTLARVSGEALEVISIGDTRAWLHSDGELRLLTEDDNVASELGLHLGDSGYGRASASLTAHVGQDVLVGPETRRVGVLGAPTRLLLTTDGVHDSLSADQIAGLMDDGDPHQAADALVAEAGFVTSDDATAVVLDLAWGQR